MARKGLGKGLDSLIPDFYNEDFDSNSPQSLEDMLNEDSPEEKEDSNDSIDEVEDSGKEANIFDQIEKEREEAEKTDEESTEELSDDNEEEIEEEVSQNVEESEQSEDADKTSEDIRSDIHSEESVQIPQEVKIQEEHVAEVKEIVDKNPRITLWSSRSSAVFRYLRKTEPEFSISKEASILIEEAVSKKYPEIWALFEDL